MLGIKDSSVILFHKLDWQKSPDHENRYLLFRTDADDALELGTPEIEVAWRLYKGEKVSDVAKNLGANLGTIKKLIVTMLETGFVRKIDDILVPDFSEKINPWLVSLPKKYFNWILDKRIVGILVFVSVVGGMLGIVVPGVRPDVEDFIWADDIALVYVVNMLTQYLLAFIHEGAHFVTTKAIGGQAKLSVSRRYLYLVFQTENYGIYKSPKRERYYVYLAGIIIDLAIAGIGFALLTVVSLWSIDIGIFYSFIQAQILLQLMSVGWQMNAYMETDLYNFLSDFWDEPNLYNNTKKILVQKIRKVSLFRTRYMKRWVDKFWNIDALRMKSDDLRAISKKRRMRMIIYAWVMVFGLLFTSYFFINYVVVREFLYLRLGVELMQVAVVRDSWFDFWKGITLVSLIIGQYILMIWVFVRGAMFDARLKEIGVMR